MAMKMVEMVELGDRSPTATLVEMEEMGDQRLRRFGGNGGGRSQGFTLVELLVAIGILATIGLVVTGLFLSHLRTTAKSKVLVEAKQNGDYALGVMERMIRNAKEIQSACPGSGETLTILNPDENTTTFDCSGSQIASNSGFLTSNRLQVTSCSFVCQKPSGKPAVVTINFTLARQGASLGREFTAEVPFAMTVSTRTY